MTALMIAPVGTCRIHNPLRSGGGRYSISPVLSRNYGFVHTSSEALQQLRFMFGELTIPSHVQTLTFRPSIPAEFHKKPYASADLYFVELSSRKLLTLDGYPIQLNYMTRYFSDFFADKKRAKMFWSMASEDRMAERRAILSEDPSFQRLSLDDRELLARILRSDLEDSEVEREMAEIAQLVGKDKLVFVTHVNASTPDNTPIEQRQRLINAVCAIAKKMNLPCYDPTPLMRELGQINAMENDGLDLTHYTDMFSEYLCADWYKSFMLPRIGSRDQQDVSITSSKQDEDDLTSIEAAWTSGQLLEASRRMHEALRKDPSRQNYRMLLGRMLYELGDYKSATFHLEAARNDVGANEQADIMLMRSYFQIAEYSHARRFAVALLSDEVETPEIVRVCAVSATCLADPGSALTDWKRLFRISEDDRAEAAGAVLEILKSMGDSSALACWAEEVLKGLPTHTPSFVALWNHRMEAADRSGLLELAHQPINLDPDVALEVAHRASEKGYATPAAVLAVAHGITTSKDPSAIAWVAERAADWLQQGTASLEAGRLLEAADNIQARWQISATGNSLIRARRALEQQMRREVRQAFVAKDYEAVVKITNIARQTLTRFPELDSFLGRAGDALGDTKTALVHLRKAADEEGAPVTSKIQLARVASRSGHYIEAIDAYYEVLQDQPNEEWALDEAKRQLVNLESRSIRSARELLVQEEHDAAWALLNRVEKASPDSQAVQREKKRVLAALRAKLKALDPASAADRLRIGETILRFAPEDEVALKAAAVGAMRMHRFLQALQYWRALREKSEDPKQIDINIQKCILWIDRAKRKKAA
jgi:tetratricopeptide (TPR) repeat protein